MPSSPVKGWKFATATVPAGILGHGQPEAALSLGYTPNKTQ
ncbi:hypothetical protein [Arthrobacter sp. Soil736]|nr:hypothetical protein [Arthrobacter sp. Soil736]